LANLPSFAAPLKRSTVEAFEPELPPSLEQLQPSNPSTILTASNNACIPTVALLRERVPRSAFDCKAPRDAELTST
jgi:hypothetical protein